MVGGGVVAGVVAALVVDACVAQDRVLLLVASLPQCLNKVFDMIKTMTMTTITVTITMTTMIKTMTRTQ